MNLMASILLLLMFIVPFISALIIIITNGEVDLFEIYGGKILAFYNFAMRGFSNHQKVLYKVYRTENLLGEVTFTLGKEYYFGRSKKPVKTEFLYRKITEPTINSKEFEFTESLVFSTDVYVNSLIKHFFYNPSFYEKYKSDNYETALEVLLDQKIKEEIELKQIEEDLKIKQLKSTTETTSYIV